MTPWASMHADGVRLKGGDEGQGFRKLKWDEIRTTTCGTLIYNPGIQDSLEEHEEE
jgi:hypothetical protein